MDIDLPKTYDDMIGLRQFLCMCNVDKTHLNDRVEIRGLYVRQTVTDILQKIGT